MEEYESYSLIQKHMYISESLYDLDNYGKHILDEIRSKKNTKPGKRGFAFCKEYESLYGCISDTINVGRFKSRLYLTLLYYLDEALFNNIPEDHDYFFIEDDKYELTKLYFDQCIWIRNHNMQRFNLTEDVELQIEDALLLNCFFTRYNETLISIEKLLSSISDEMRYKRKISSVITRIKAKHAIALNIIENCVSTHEDIDIKIER